MITLMKWHIHFFNERVFDDAQSMPKGIKAKFIRITELVEEFGPEIGMPHIETIKGSDCHGLFEMRPKGRYCPGRK